MTNDNKSAKGWIFPNGLGRLKINLQLKFIAIAIKIINAKNTFIINKICEFELK